MWVLGIKLRPSSLWGGVFTHWSIAWVPVFLFQDSLYGSYFQIHSCFSTTVLTATKSEWGSPLAHGEVLSISPWGGSCCLQLLSVCVASNFFVPVLQCPFNQSNVKYFVIITGLICLFFSVQHVILLLCVCSLLLWDHFQRQKVEPGGSGTRL